MIPAIIMTSVLTGGFFLPRLPTIDKLFAVVVCIGLIFTAVESVGSTFTPVVDVGVADMGAVVVVELPGHTQEELVLSQTRLIGLKVSPSGQGQCSTVMPLTL